MNLATSVVASSDLPIGGGTMARVMLYVDHERSEEAIVLEHRTPGSVGRTRLDGREDLQP